MLLRRRSLEPLDRCWGTERGRGASVTLRGRSRPEPLLGGLDREVDLTQPRQVELVGRGWLHRHSVVRARHRKTSSLYTPPLFFQCQRSPHPGHVQESAAVFVARRLRCPKPASVCVCVAPVKLARGHERWSRPHLDSNARRLGWFPGWHEAKKILQIFRINLFKIAHFQTKSPLKSKGTSRAEFCKALACLRVIARRLPNTTTG